MSRPAWWKNARWLQVVRGLPCLRCGARRPVEAHHVDALGMSAKNPDAMAIPLCRGHHAGHHDRNDPTKEWCREALAQFWVCVTVATGGILEVDDAARERLGERAYRLQLAEVMDGEIRKLLDDVGGGGSLAALRATEEMEKAMRQWGEWRQP